MNLRRVKITADDLSTVAKKMVEIDALIKNETKSLNAGRRRKVNKAYERGDLGRAYLLIKKSKNVY